MNSRLSRAIDRYLDWMTDNNYAQSTVQNYKNTLQHFQRFVDQRKIRWSKVFTQDCFREFESLLLSYQAHAVRGLGRYLYNQAQIPHPIEKPGPRLPVVYEQYLSYCRTIKKASTATLLRTRKLLSALQAHLDQNNITLTSISIEQIDRFLSVLNAGFKPATCRHHRCGLRGFLKYLYHDRRLIKRDLAALVVGAPDYAQAQPPKFLRLPEVEQLFTILPADSAKDLRCRAMVHLAYTLGLRPKEISRIRLDDIAFENSQIAIPDRKSTQPVRLPLPEVTLKALADYVVGGRPQSAHRQLFLNLYAPYRPVTAASASHDISAAVRRANPAASAYWLRHTYAQNLLESGASLFEVKHMLGHDNLNATRRYLHIHVKLMREVLFDETL